MHAALIKWRAEIRSGRLFLQRRGASIADILSEHILGRLSLAFEQWRSRSASEAKLVGLVAQLLPGLARLHDRTGCKSAWARWRSRCDASRGACFALWHAAGGKRRLWVRWTRHCHLGRDLQTRAVLSALASVRRFWVRIWTRWLSHVLPFHRRLPPRTAVEEHRRLRTFKRVLQTLLLAAWRSACACGAARASAFRRALRRWHARTQPDATSPQRCLLLAVETSQRGRCRDAATCAATLRTLRQRGAQRALAKGSMALATIFATKRTLSCALERWLRWLLSASLVSNHSTPRRDHDQLPFLASYLASPRRLSSSGEGAFAVAAKRARVEALCERTARHALGYALRQIAAAAAESAAASELAALATAVATEASRAAAFGVWTELPGRGGCQGDGIDRLARLYRRRGDCGVRLERLRHVASFVSVAVGNGSQ